jgi:hypothetical protein
MLSTHLSTEVEFSSVLSQGEFHRISGVLQESLLIQAASLFEYSL